MLGEDWNGGSGGPATMGGVSVCPTLRQEKRVCIWGGVSMGAQREKGKEREGMG